MAKGGARPGAGRPQGSKNRLSFRDYWTEEEIIEFVQFTKENYMGDMGVHKWTGAQLFGAPSQSIDHTTLGEKLPTPLLANVPTDDSPKEN